MAYVSISLRFWMHDNEAKRLASGSYFTRGHMLSNLIAGDLDGQLDSQISYGDIKVKMDDDIPDSNAT